MSGALTAVRGKYPGFALNDKKGCEMKSKQAVGDNSSGLTNKQSRQGGAFSGVCRTKSPRHSPGVVGLWLQMTSA